MRKLALVLMSISLYANGKIVANQTVDDTWVKHCQGDRIYVDSHRLIIVDHGIFLFDDSNQKIPIFKLFSDSQGIYIKSESISTRPATVYPIVWCKTCEAWRTVDTRGNCTYCGNSP